MSATQQSEANKNRSQKSADNNPYVDENLIHDTHFQFSPKSNEQFINKYKINKDKEQKNDDNSTQQTEISKLNDNVFKQIENIINETDENLNNLISDDIEMNDNALSIINKIKEFHKNVQNKKREKEEKEEKKEEMRKSMICQQNIDINENYAREEETWIIIDKKKLLHEIKENMNENTMTYLQSLFSYIIPIESYHKLNTKSSWNLLNMIANYFQNNVHDKNDDDDDDDDANDNDNDDNSSYLENKRIVRLPINEKLLICIKVIFNQIVSKLDCLNNDQFIELKKHFEVEMDENYNKNDGNINKFILKYLKNETFIEVKTDNFIGSVMIKFKKDDNNEKYIFVLCHVMTTKYTKNVDDISHIKNTINNKIKNQIE